MNILVTGGLGFIGSNLVDELIKKGHKVIVIDDLSTGKEIYANSKADYIMDSILNIETVNKITKGIDVIFHEAAWARVQRSVNDPIGTNKVNVDGTLVLLESARMNQVKKFIFASSSSVYGNQESAIMHETMSLKPLHPYGLQKMIGECYCELYSKLFKLNTICLRYFNVYGERQVLEGEYALVIGKFIRQLAEGRKMTIYGDGRQTRAYTHVSDIVNANIRAMEANTLDGEHLVFNVGGNTETSVNEIAELLGGQVKHIEPNPRGNFEEKRKASDYTRIKEFLGWEPKVSIREGIKMLLQR